MEAGDSMTPKSKSAVRYAVVTSLLGAGLSIAGLIIVISQSGYGWPSVLCVVLVYLGYWPVLLIGWSPHDLFVSFWVIPVNVAAWSLVGLLLGWTRQALSRRKADK